MSHLGNAWGSRSSGNLWRSSRHVVWKTSADSCGANPYFTGIEKMRALYLSTSADQASSLPFKHSATSRLSEAPAKFSDFDVVNNGLNASTVLRPCGDKVAPHSR